MKPFSDWQELSGTGLRIAQGISAMTVSVLIPTFSCPAYGENSWKSSVSNRCLELLVPCPCQEHTDTLPSPPDRPRSSHSPWYRRGLCKTSISVRVFFVVPCVEKGIDFFPNDHFMIGVRFRILCNCLTILGGRNGCRSF